MNDGNIDILVGTQTITKGYHFPNVTLVGIIWADINLQLPFYNATEITLQQLIPVAGRAGRQSPESLVIVQSMQDHPVFSYLHEQDYQKFYEYEKEHRTTTGYPPIKKLAIIELRCRDEHIIDQEARAIALVLHQLVNKHQITVTILGPAQPPVSRVKNVYTRKMYLKAPSMGHLIQLYHALNQNNYQSSLFFTPQPVNDTSY
jgi:primosomal protein N' (replication factor Y)